MRLIVGLGNPGAKYKTTRHNAGFLFLDTLTDASFEEDPYLQAAVAKEDGVIFAKPTTFMNDSGLSVKAMLQRFKLTSQELVVIHDDLDIPLGEYKIQKGIGPKLHNGVTSIEEEINSKDFLRLRVGVDNRDPENRTPGEAYVLENFLSEELEKLHEVFEKLKYEKDLLIH